MPSRDEILQQDTLRDIAAARAEFSGRRDQVVAEYEERLGALEALASSFEEGAIDAKTTQNRVRQLLGDRASGSTSRRAGRTTIGLNKPTKPGNAPPGAHWVSSGPSVGRTSTLIKQVVSELDSRIMTTLSRGLGNGGKDEARMELALLRHLRQGLSKHAEGLPEDVVLLSSITEYAETGQQILEDLINGGMDRIRRFVDYDRTLVSELTALGGSPGDAKAQLKRMRQRLGEGANTVQQTLLKEALTLFARLQTELDRKVPPRAKSLLDEFLRS